MARATTRRTGPSPMGRTQEQQRLGEIWRDLDGLRSETLEVLLICGD